MIRRAALSDEPSADGDALDTTIGPWLDSRPEGMAVARAKGRLRGKKPKLSARQARELRHMHDTEDYSVSDLAEVFSVSRPTVYRTLQRQATAT